jgi:hypothetical protein
MNDSQNRKRRYLKLIVKRALRGRVAGILEAADTVRDADSWIHESEEPEE